MTRIILTLTLIFAPGCSFLQKPNVEYVKANRSFYNLVGHRISDTWVPNDSELTESEKMLIDNAVADWLLMITTAEKSLGLDTENE